MCVLNIFQYTFNIHAISFNDQQIQYINVNVPTQLEKDNSYIIQYMVIYSHTIFQKKCYTMSKHLISCVFPVPLEANGASKSNLLRRTKFHTAQKTRSLPSGKLT